jgi:hypothetical protein
MLIVFIIAVRLLRAALVVMQQDQGQVGDVVAGHISAASVFMSLVLRRLSSSTTALACYM